VKEAAAGSFFFFWLTLSRVSRGPARSYGIGSGAAGGLPSAVIERAKRVLRQLEASERFAAANVQVETADPVAV